MRLYKLYGPLQPDAVILCFCLIEALDNLAVDDQGNGGSQCDYSKIIPDVMGITAGSEPFATSGEPGFRQGNIYLINSRKVRILKWKTKTNAGG